MYTPSIKHVLVFLLPVLIFSCKKDDSGPDEPATTSCSVDTLWVGTKPKVMTFDSQGRISKIERFSSAAGTTVDESYTYTYNDTGVVVDYYSYAMGTGKLTASLDAKGNFDKASIDHLTWDHTEADYDYNDQNQLVKVNFIYYNPNEYDYQTTYYLTWENGNVVKRERYDSVVYVNPNYTGGTLIEGLNYKYNYTYASEPNKGYKNINFYTFVDWLNYPFIGATPVNMIQKVESISMNFSDTTEYTYPYVLDDKGYVVQDQTYDKIVYLCD